MSSTERVRQFRARNPDYARRYKRKRPTKEMLRALMAKLLAEANAAEAAKAATPPAAAPPPSKPVLMLPAPAQDPAMEAINALAASLKSRSTSPAPLPIPHVRSEAA